MKKNLVYVLIVLLLVLAVILINRSKNEARKATSDVDFTVISISEVDRIVITDKKGTADLRREGDHWKINGRYRVMQPKMDVLLHTVNKLVVHAPVSHKRLEAVMKAFDEGATRVQIFRNGEAVPFKVYYVDGTTEDSKGTYMLMEINGKKAQRPHVLTIPGFTGVLNVRYFTDETEWRDTNIFDYSMDDIKQVSVSYPMSPQHSFSLTVVGKDSFEIKPMEGYHAASNARLYKEGVIKYLSSFEFLNAEAYANEHPKKDSVLNATPVVTVTVSEGSGHSKQMIVYNMPLGKRSKTQFDREGERLPYDLDRFFASINKGQDFVIIQNFVFGNIFKRYSDFFVKQPAPAS